MSTDITLKNRLKAIHGKDYGRYQSLLGNYDFSDTFRLDVHQIPKDPFAPPHTGIYRIRVDRSDKRIINFDIRSKIQAIAFRDFIARRFYQASEEISKGRRGAGYSGAITINPPGQAVLDRNCVVIDEQVIEIRCFLGLPANGRVINATIAEKMFFRELPEIIDYTVFQKNINHSELNRHIATAEDADYLRGSLDSMGIVAFIADGAILPRRSGTSDLPMQGKTIPFSSPDSLKLEIELPYAGLVSGMGVPKGVTLIAGGGYHGKSTLLKAIETGCYNHIPDDGRERCVSLTNSVKVRAYSGRSIVKTDISHFISNLPMKKDTTEFSTENASGSTSQAAGIIEAIEIGAKVLLMDEDTCATNFMIRDAKMQKLVQKGDEPITAYIDRVRQLYSEKQISTIIVLGGIGDYFEVSDHVIQMINYKPVDATSEAHKISRTSQTNRENESEETPFNLKDRIPLPDSINPYNDYGKKRIIAKDVHRLHFGETIIDLGDLEQLAELSQTKSIGYALDYAKQYMDQKSSLKEIINQIMKDIDTQTLDVLSEQISGHFAEFRPFELAFAFNRLRGIKVLQKSATER